MVRGIRGFSSMLAAIFFAQMPGALFRVIAWTENKCHGIGGADGYASRAIIAFLAKVVAQWIEPKLADDVTFCAIIAGFDNAPNAHDPVATKQRVKCAARTKVAAEPALCHKEIKQEGDCKKDSTCAKSAKGYEIINLPSYNGWWIN